MRDARKPGEKAPAGGLGKKDLEEFERLLLLRKKLLMGQVEGLEDQARQKGPAAGELSNVPVHLADIASDLFEQDLSLGRAEDASDEIKEIDDAIERIRDGSFGVCEDCRKRIPRERLQAIPWTRFCVPCQTKREEEAA